MNPTNQMKVVSNTTDQSINKELLANSSAPLMEGGMPVEKAIIRVKDIKDESVKPKEKKLNFPVKIIYNSYCAPGRGKDGISCFTKESLQKISKTFKLPTSGDKSELKARLNSKLGKDERVWLKYLKKMGMKDEEIMKNSLRPEYPGEWRNCDTNQVPNSKCKYTWLHTFNIEDVLKQYENQFPNYKFMGAVPMDFEKIDEDYKNLDLWKEYQEGKDKIGMIFNLDYSYQPGSHWTCMFIDIDTVKCEFNYFDSYGKISGVPDEVYKYVTRIGSEWEKKSGGEGTFKTNNVRFQFGNSECSIYSMYTIIQRLFGKSFEDICDHPMPDELMNKFRKLLYS